ncbi:MAG: hypothetical protein ACI9NY_002063 [Kiritimatiellia bacterium]|jgi:hypothetical protein
MAVFKCTAIVLFLLVSACAPEPTNSYCSAHKSAHKEHQMEVAKLVINANKKGLVEINFSLPSNQLENTNERLKQVENILEVRGQGSCTLVFIDVNQEGESVKAKYHLDCGVNKPLKQVDIKLLDNFPNLDEVEADIKTAAVRKHFVISRQCKKPIFEF